MKTRLLIPFLLLASISQAQESQRPPLRLIVASATESVRVAPDQATVRVGVERQAPTAMEAMNQVNTVSARIIEAALKVVSNRQDYRTSELSLHPVYSNPRPNQQEEPRIVGYRARNIITVRIHDLTKVGPLIDAATGAGATNIDSINFGLRDDSAAKREALMAASRAAKAKAQAIAEALGVGLGPLHDATEGHVGVVPRYESMDMMAARAAPAQVMPGDLEISATVTVRYGLDPR